MSPCRGAGHGQACFETALSIRPGGTIAEKRAFFVGSDPAKGHAGQGCHRASRGSTGSERAAVDPQVRHRGVSPCYGRAQRCTLMERVVESVVDRIVVSVAREGHVLFHIDDL